jgi:hypothetical protein
MRGKSKPDWRAGKQRYMVHFSTGSLRKSEREWRFNRPAVGSIGPSSQEVRGAVSHDLGVPFRQQRGGHPA